MRTVPLALKNTATLLGFTKPEIEHGYMQYEPETTVKELDFMELLRTTRNEKNASKSSLIKTNISSIMSPSLKVSEPNSKKPFIRDLSDDCLIIDSGNIIF